MKRNHFDLKGSPLHRLKEWSFKCLSVVITLKC